MSSAAILQAIELNGVAVEANKRSFAWGRLAASDLDLVRQIAEPQMQIMPKAAEDTLQSLTGRRKDYLTDYQNDGYARRYEKLVQEAEAAESSLAGDQQLLSRAVARYFFKLMSYKDEYEVARLYSDGSFMDRVNSQFEGDFKLKFHMAPPILARRDEASGHLKKQEFGPWMMKAFGLLARFKFLRGTTLDPFGKTEERKREVALIAEYEQTITETLSKLTAENYAIAVEIAEVPEIIRGFGHVKEQHLENAVKLRADLLQRFKIGDTTPIAAQ